MATINLRQARKRRQREQRAQDAERNRERHGVPGAVRRAAEADEQQARRKLDAHRLDSAGPATTEGES